MNIYNSLNQEIKKKNKIEQKNHTEKSLEGRIELLTKNTIFPFLSSTHNQISQ